MSFALARFHIPNCRPLEVSRILSHLVHPEGFETLLHRRAEISNHVKNTLSKPDRSAQIDFKVLVQQLKSYLPDAFALTESLKSIPSTAQLPEIDFGWTSGLTKQPEKIYSFPSGTFELAMTLMTLAYAQFNFAAQKMQMAKVSEIEICKEIATLLCEIAGLLEFIEDRIKELDTFPATKKPLEFLSSASLKGLSCLAMAEAEEIGAINAEERQMKSTIVAKLYLHSSDLYRDAYHNFDLLRKHADFPKSESGLFQEYLQVFVLLKSSLLLAAAYRHLGIDAKQNESHGLAVTYLQLASVKIGEVVKSKNSSTIFSNTSDSLSASLEAQVRAEEKKIQILQEKYTKENESVFFEPLTQPDQLKLPNSVGLFKIKPFSVPTFTTFDTTLKEKREDDGCLIS